VLRSPSRSWTTAAWAACVSSRRRVSSWEFDDLDGVRVLVSLVVDADERLYELELWKSDFGRLLQLPEFDGTSPSE